jgi:hypothetical protein
MLHDSTADTTVIDNAETASGNGGTQKPPAKHRGAHAELIACAWLLEQGYEVFRNVSACGSADLIACKDGELLRIDVSSGRRTARMGFYRHLRPEQKRDGVTFLYVDERGRCELIADRDRRLAEEARASLAEVAGLLPGLAAEQLNLRGIRTPNGARWMAGNVTQWRQRLGL